jgi:hypothetical protein
MERPSFRVDTGETGRCYAISCVADLFYLQEGRRIAGKLIRLRRGHGSCGIKARAPAQEVLCDHARYARGRVVHRSGECGGGAGAPKQRTRGARARRRMHPLRGSFDREVSRFTSLLDSRRAGRYCTSHWIRKVEYVDPGKEKSKTAGCKITNDKK